MWFIRKRDKILEKWTCNYCNLKPKTRIYVRLNLPRLKTDHVGPLLYATCVYFPFHYIDIITDQNASLSAPPITPFPIIQECQQSTDSYAGGSECSLPLSSVNITCDVLGYFPSISLYFLHDSAKVPIFQSMEWNNTDGTRNKSVTIRAEASNEPYICVASDIPGLGSSEWNSSIYLTAIPEETTTANATTVGTTRLSSDGHNDDKIGEYMPRHNLHCYH